MASLRRLSWAISNASTEGCAMASSISRWRSPCFFRSSARWDSRDMGALHGVPRPPPGMRPPCTKAVSGQSATVLHGCRMLMGTKANSGPRKGSTGIGQKITPAACPAGVQPLYGNVGRANRLQSVAALDRIERCRQSHQGESVARIVAAPGNGGNLHVRSGLHGCDELRLLRCVFHPGRLALREHDEGPVADRHGHLRPFLEVIGGDELRLVGYVLPGLLADEEE